MKLLITGGKSSASLKLLKYFKAEEVSIADYGDMPVFPSKEYKFVSLGSENQDTTAHTLLTFCLDNEFNALVPVYGFEVESVLKSRVLFEEFGIQVLIPSEFDAEHLI